MNNLTDSELLGRYTRTNDEQAFRELHDRHRANVLRFLTNQVSAHDARDLMQEVFICVWKLHHTYTPGANVGAWLISIARGRVQKHNQDKARALVRQYA